ncbi:protein FAM177B [Genypterus blacodes]|uniref:protein FAM177B n=1 Tax=Genypterus blacodes TaxID=154954 RepID=UPI003F763EC2
MDSHQEGTDIQETQFGGPALSKQKRIIYFSSGETLEEEDDSEEEEQEAPFHEPAQRARFSWRNVAMLVARTSLLTCDFLGARLAGVLGLKAAKYQYAIDEYHRDQNKKTQNQATESVMDGQAGTLHLSHYGATGTIGSPAGGDQGSQDEKQKDTDKGCHNKGYQNED